MYEVQQVLRGGQAPQRVLVGHWAVRDRRTVAGAQREEGRTYEMRVQPYQDCPRLDELPRNTGTEELQLPVYYDLHLPAPRDPPADR